MKLTTLKNYDFFEVSSAFQKAIRRGDEDTAMYFAVELFNSGYGEYLWKRIKVICSEDIGLAEPYLPAVIAALYDAFIAQVKKNDEKHKPERLQITHAVLLLARAKKSRLVDWALLAYWAKHEHEKREIPDYAYDKHTIKGRHLKRSIDFTYVEGTKLENHYPQAREDELKKCAYLAEKKNLTLFET